MVARRMLLAAACGKAREKKPRGATAAAWRRRRTAGAAQSAPRATMVARTADGPGTETGTGCPGSGPRPAPQQAVWPPALAGHAHCAARPRPDPPPPTPQPTSGLLGGGEESLWEHNSNHPPTNNTMLGPDEVRVRPTAFAVGAVDVQVGRRGAGGHCWEPKFVRESRLPPRSRTNPLRCCPPQAPPARVGGGGG